LENDLVIRCKTNSKGEKQMRSKIFFVVLVFLLVVGNSAMADAEWNYGVGTGFFFLNVDGTIGLNSTIAGGPVELDVDLDPEEVRDLLESAFGIGGYATDGNWTIQFALKNLELEGEERKQTPLGQLSATLGFEVTGAEVAVGYAVYKRPKFIFSVLGGGRYTKHELTSDLRVGALRQTRNIDNDWTDVLVGATAVVPFTEKWTWNNRFDAGFGGSEGTYTVNTGLTWRFAEHWSTTLYGQYAAIEFENASKGDSDWYLYDTDEFGVGINVSYNW
jgi:hypothetical protein